MLIGAIEMNGKLAKLGLSILAAGTFAGVGHTATFYPPGTKVQASGDLYMSDGYYYDYTCHYEFAGETSDNGSTERLTVSSVSGSTLCADPASMRVKKTITVYHNAQTGQINALVPIGALRPLLGHAFTYAGEWNNAGSQLVIPVSKGINGGGYRFGGTLTLSPPVYSQ
jgi:hypothetical protein